MDTTVVTKVTVTWSSLFQVPEFNEKILISSFKTNLSKGDPRNPFKPWTTNFVQSKLPDHEFQISITVQEYNRRVY